MSTCLPPTPPTPTPTPTPSDGNYGFWNYGGRNGLKGAASTLEVLPDGRRVIVKDPVNPALLEDEFIVYSLQRVPQARHDFNRLFPTLLPDEQARYVNLFAANPRAAAPMLDEQTFYDNLQLAANTAGIHLNLPKPRNPGPAYHRRHP